MVHTGLAELPNRPKTYWQRMIDRLVDARVHEVAAQLREISTLPGARPDWATEVLRRIGRLYLLTQGFQRFDTLPLPNQADLQAAVGWLPDLDYENPANDDWIVLGRSLRTVDKSQIHATWLIGRTSQRFALLEQVVRKATETVTLLPTGAIVSAEMIFRHSAAPIRAVTGHVRSIALATTPATTVPLTITSAHTAYRVAIAANPWIDRFPMLLRAALPAKSSTGWTLVATDDAVLPLDETFSVGWHLLALSGGRALDLFGEWDGAFLQPLSVQIDGDWRDLHIIRGIA
jgi:hypothetical protein